MASRGKNEKIYQENTGNFLSLIEMISEFDPIVQEHVWHIQHGSIHNHYLGHNIQNELIQLLANEIKVQLLKRLSVYLAKIIFAKLFYYSTYFCYYLWVSLHFLVIFMGPTVLFQLTFTFIYSTFSKKFSISTK